MFVESCIVESFSVWLLNCEPHAREVQEKIMYLRSFVEAVMLKALLQSLISKFCKHQAKFKSFVEVVLCWDLITCEGHACTCRKQEWSKTEQPHENLKVLLC